MVGMGAMFLLPGVMPMLSGRSYAGSAWVTLLKGTKRKLHEMGGTPSGSDVHWEAMQEPSQPIDIKYERAEIEDFPPTSNVRWEAMNSQT